MSGRPRTSHSRANLCRLARAARGLRSPGRAGSRAHLRVVGRVGGGRAGRPGRMGPCGDGDERGNCCGRWRRRGCRRTPLRAARDRQPGRAGDAVDQRRARVERRGAPAAAHDRPVHRGGPPRHVRPRGGRGGADRPRHRRRTRARRTPTWTCPSSPAPCAPAAPRPCGRAGGSSASARSSPQLCRELGIVFVGPSPEVMRALGDKIESKLLAAQVGVPMAAWSGGPVDDLAAARAHAEEIGYPLMVKATAGGGGRGIRLVARPEELDEAFTRAAAEGARTAGDGTVFLERALRGGRHVEVQVVADATGDVWTLGVRDCSVQRRNQKVLEESASVALDAEQDRAAVRVRRPAGPRGGLRQRRHRRVPLRAGRPSALVPRGQHAAAGGAPGHRGDHRRRRRQAPAARRDGRPAGRDRPGRAPARTDTRSRPG